MTDTPTAVYGVFGESDNDYGAGVYGSGKPNGVYGHSEYGVGVRGYASATTGYNYGVYGQSDSIYGRGVYGYAAAVTGTVFGVYGYAAPSGSGYATAGVYGRSLSDDGFGVAGHNYYSGVGVGAWSYSGNLIEAYDGDYPAGTLRFYVDQSGNVYADGTFNSFVELEGESTARSLSAIQSPGAWLEDFGAATLVDGRAVVNIEPLFAQTVNLGVDYHVFLTPLGDCQGLYVAAKTPISFEVRELGGGKANVAFDYRIVARRLGHEQARLEAVNVPEPIVTDRGER